MLIIGPCSADREDSVMDYVCRLVPLQEKVKDKILIVPRIYTNKPRTNGSGYKGMLHQPDPSKKPDMLEGIIAIRAGYHYGKLVPSHASLGAGFSFKGFNLDFSYLISKKDCPVNNSAVLRLGYCF